MATYWITFRVGDIGDYNARYDALQKAVSNLKDGAKWWVEPTSFFVFNSKHSIDEVAAAVKKALNTLDDMALIGMPEFKDARVVGTLEDDDLFFFMPFTKKA